MLWTISPVLSAASPASPDVWLVFLIPTFAELWDIRQPCRMSPNHCALAPMLVGQQVRGGLERQIAEKGYGTARADRVAAALTRQPQHWRGRAASTKITAFAAYMSR